MKDDQEGKSWGDFLDQITLFINHSTQFRDLVDTVIKDTQSVRKHVSVLRLEYNSNCIKIDFSEIESDLAELSRKFDDLRTEFNDLIDP